jgi:hypothetical protein
MKPAFALGLNAEQLKLIGEICMIQSQIDLHMVSTVQHLLKVSYRTALDILGSTAIENRIKVWADVIRDKGGNEELTKLAEKLQTEARIWTGKRNSIIHGIAYVEIAPKDGVILVGEPGYETGKVTLGKVKTASTEDLDATEIASVRDTAAKFSIWAAHILFTVLFGQSQWQDKLPE